MYVDCNQDVPYADNLALVVNTRKKLQNMVNVAENACG